MAAPGPDPRSPPANRGSGPLIVTPGVVRPASNTPPPGLRSGEYPTKAAAPVWNESLAGQVLGNFRLMTRIGRGPRGSVYEAEDLQLQRRVALKVLAPEIATSDPNQTARFVAEARAASRFDHPHCLSVYGVGQAGGTVFYSMPLVRGGSALDALQAGGRFTPVEATRIAKQVAKALVAIHASGRPHGNLKPGNILLGESANVKVTDFGIAPPGTLDPLPDLRALAALYGWLLTGQPQSTTEPPSSPGLTGSGSYPYVPSLCLKLSHAFVVRADEPPYRTAADFLAALEAAEELLVGPATLPVPVDVNLSGSSVGSSRVDSSNRSTPVNVNVIPLPATSRLEIGQVLGKCLLTERVGAGSSGTVFRGLHQTLNIAVAVKVLNVGSSESEANVRRQLKSEARLLAQLNHPNIVRVWDLEESGEHPYLVLEYVEGLSLGELVQQSGRLRLDRAARIINQVAGALAAGFKMGIVHRDVKPANILIARDGTAKLADLGLAVVIGERMQALASGGVPADTMAGTVAYMSPEQAVVAPQIDHRSDVYSLGATFYHALTGTIPFKGRSRMEVILKHAKEQPRPPHELVPELDPSASAVVLRMLAKQPANRHQTYEELQADLAGLMLGESPRPTPPISAAPVKRSWWSWLRGTD